jgi:hypothetical protein
MNEEQLKEFYESVRDAQDVDQVITDMTSRGLRELGGWLVREGAHESNVMGDVLGRVIVEGYRRWVAMVGFTEGGDA